MSQATNFENKNSVQSPDRTLKNRDKWCGEELLEKVFRSLDKEGKDRINEMVIPVKYPKGDLIFQEGALSDGIYFVCSGLVVYGKKLNGNTDRKRIFKLMGPGDILGEETLFCSNPESRFGYARSIVRTDLLFLERSSLLDFLEDRPRLFRDFCRNVTLGLQELEKKLLHEGFLNTDRRLANLLVKVEGKLGKGEENSEGCIKLRRKTLAEILGVSKGSITKSLKKLERKKLVSLKEEKICVRSRENLREFVNK